MIEIKKIWITATGSSHTDYYGSDMNLIMLDDKLIEEMMVRIESYVHFLQDTSGRMAEELRSRNND